MWDDITSLGAGMDSGLLVAMVGVVVAGFAAVLGIWMERDHNKPPRYAYALSALILLATAVSVMQSYIDSKAGEKLEEDMARLIQQMDKIASNSNDPALQDLIKNELSAQSRANPDIVQKLAQRVSDEGGDPTELLGKHLDASEVEGIARKGLVKTKKKGTKVAKKKAPPKDAGPSPAELKAAADKKAAEDAQRRAAMAAKAAAAQKAAAANAPAGGGDAAASSVGARAGKAMKARSNAVGSRDTGDKKRRRAGGGDDGDKKDAKKAPAKKGAKKGGAKKGGPGGARGARGRGR